ncbi:MAG TPA: sigma-70 family RNA polymerase sigma factor [Chloroflexota bacterium]|jgi:RNA polymerase primary sigma factor
MDARERRRRERQSRLQRRRKIRRLLAIARARGYLTLEEVFRVASSSPPDLEDVEDVLEEAGVRLVVDEEELEEPETEWEDVAELEDEELVDEAEVLMEEPETAEEAALEPAYTPGDSAAAIYLRDISRVPLLTAEQEVELAKAYEEGRAAARRLRQRGLSAEERERLEEAVRRGEEAKRRLTESNLRLVVSVARKYMNRGLPLLDLIQEGNIGLSRAVDKYDYRKGYRFSTYAYWWIRQAVTRAIADQARTIRIPVHMIELIGDYFRVARELEQDLGREPEPEEIAKALNVTPEKVRQITRAAKQPISLETPVGEEDENTIADFIADRAARSPAEVAADELLKEHVDDILQTLTERERAVLRLRFGLVDGRARTLGEIGEELGVSRERVRQIEAEALAKLRHPKVRSRLREYLE